VTVGVNVTIEGDYKIKGRLDAPVDGGFFNSLSIAWATNSTYLTIGVHNITLRFEGIDVSRRATNGPYQLKYLRVYDSNWNLLDSRYKSYNTTAYNYTDFESETGEFTDSSTWTESTTDPNSDGKYNTLDVTVGVDVSNNGSYRVEALLVDDATGYPITHAVKNQLLGAGTRNVTLSFDGRTIRSKGLNGTYRIRVIRLVDRSYALWIELDKEFNVYTTQSYNATDFETPEASFTGNYWDAGSDENNNSLFDYLNVTVEVSVNSNGTYSIHARLADLFARKMKWEKNKLNLTAGTHNVTIQFDGMQIRNTGLNGPYMVRRLILLDRTAGGKTVLDDRFMAHTTAAYNFTQFETPDASITGPYSDAGVDTDSDSKYNFVSITVGLNVSANGTYMVRGELAKIEGAYPTKPHRVWDYNHIMWTRNISNLTVGANNVTLYFDAERLVSGGWDGPYLLRHVVLHEVYSTIQIGNTVYYLVNESKPLDHEFVVHATTAYNTTDFDAPAIQLNDPCCSDRPLDTDSDGEYNHLVIDVSVQVNNEGHYTVEGRLSDLIDVGDEYIRGEYKETKRNTTHLANGTRSVSLYFDGMLIRNIGSDGFYKALYVSLIPENVSDELKKHRTYTLLDAWITETYYNTSDFETPVIRFSDNYADTAVDTNGNSLYDHIVINVSVEVTTAGLYLTSGLIRPTTGRMEVGALKLSLLTVGNHTIQLPFRTTRLGAAGLDGPYTLHWIELKRIDDHKWKRVDLDWNVHNTIAYNSTQLEGSA